MPNNYPAIEQYKQLHTNIKGGKLTNLKLWQIIMRHFGIPYNYFELTYQDVIDYIYAVTIPDFSRYVPYYVVLQAIRISPNVYQLQLDDWIEVLGIINVIPSSTLALLKRPFLPIISTYDSAIRFALKTQNANLLRNLSSYTNVNWRWIYPDKIRVVPDVENYSSNTASGLIVEAAIVHPSVETIPTKFRREFIQLCIADIKQLLGDIRSRYTEYQTPFGNINLNADTLKSEAEQLRQNIIEKLSTLPPYKIVSKGTFTGL